MVIVGSLLISAVIYIFLIMPRMFKRPSRKKLMGVHYAHRGLFDNESYAPENSIPAFKKAVAAGYGIEFDVQLSKDNKLVVFHDADLKRMCGVDGNVWNYSLEELKKMKLAGSNETIPTFEEVLDVVNGQVPLIIEFKLDRAQTKVCELADKQLTKYKGPYCIESFHPLALMWYRKNKPDVIRGQLSMEFWKDERYAGKLMYVFLSYLVTNVATRPDFIAYQHSDAANLSRRLCRMFGALSVAWTIKSKKQYEAAKDEFELFIFDSFEM